MVIAPSSYRHICVNPILINCSSCCAPEEDISLTTNSQPAIMATSIAILRSIQSAELLDMNEVKLVAGHSLGEYASLVATESLGFSDAAKLLKVRSEAMQESMPVGTGGMVALIGVTIEQVDEILPMAEIQVL